MSISNIAKLFAFGFIDVAVGSFVPLIRAAMQPEALLRGPAERQFTGPVAERSGDAPEVGADPARTAADLGRGAVAGFDRADRGGTSEARQVVAREIVAFLDHEFEQERRTGPGARPNHDA